MKDFEFRLGDPIEIIFKTSSIAHDHIDDTSHTHSHSYDMEMDIYANNKKLELFYQKGMVDGVDFDNNIIILIFIGNSSELGLGSHKYNISVIEEDENNCILQESGIITISLDAPPANDIVAKPWDLLNPLEPRVTKEAAKTRMSICTSCPELKLGICMKCMCKMKWKTTLAGAFCPLHKW